MEFDFVGPLGYVGIPGEDGAKWTTCPRDDADSGINSGHVILVWNIGTVRYGVSVHSDTPTNRQLERAFATAITYVDPSES